MNAPIEKRLTAVEKRVEYEAGQRAKLATSVSDIQVRQKATFKLIEALRETQVEQGQKQEEQGQVLAEHGQALDRLERGMNELSRTVAEHSAKLEGVETRLEGVETKVDRLGVQMERVIELLQPPPGPETVAAN